ncbi:MAG: DUF11 domain-containing protein, partial [Promicromonosporaceae bacterium]|nr:DUF11 domain-containing protein [Promicromonosporaceae bacterium]
MSESFVLVSKGKQQRRRGLLATLLTATLITSLLGGTAHATVGGDSYGSELDRSDLDFLSGELEGGVATDLYTPDDTLVEGGDGSHVQAHEGDLFGDDAEAALVADSDIPEGEFFWNIGPEGYAYQVDAEGTVVDWEALLYGYEATPGGPAAGLAGDEDVEWGSWDDSHDFIGVDFGDDFAAFSAAVDPFNACAGGTQAAPSASQWNQSATNSRQSHNANWGGGVTSRTQQFYVYANACHQLDVRFLTNRWRDAHNNGAQRVTLFITDPTGNTIRTTLNRGVPAGQRGTGAMAAANGTTNPLQRLGLRSATAGVWHIRTRVEDANGNSVSLASQGRGWSAHRFDIAVRDPQGRMQSPGRVWTDTLQQTFDSHTQATVLSGSARWGVRWNQRHWAMTSEGLRFEITQRSFNGIHSAMRVNGTGVHLNCRPVFRSMLAHHAPHQNPGGRNYSVAGASNCGLAAGRIFWAPPDINMPRTARFPNGSTGWVNPQQVNPSVSVRYEQGTSTTNYGGTIVVTTNQAGPITVVIAGSGTNRTITLPNARAGTSRIAWDGRNGANQVIPLTASLTINVSLEAGRTHFVHQDVEYREGGIEVRALNGPFSGRRLLHWGEPHHSQHCWENGTQRRCAGLFPTPRWGSADSAGGAHRWGRSNMNTPVYGVDGVTTWGDGRQMNEWMPGTVVNSSMRLGPAASCTMTGAPRLIPAGQEVTHRVTVRNDGQVRRAMTAAIDISQALQGGRTTLVAGSITASPGSVTQSGNILNWSGTLNPGQTATITYRLRAASPAQNATFTSTVTVPGPNGQTCTVTNETQAAPAAPGNPTCIMTASPRLVQPGAETTHTLTITNTGNQQRALTSQTSIANHLSGGRFTFVDNSLQASVGSATRSGNNINWSGTVAAGAVVTITYRLRAANPSTAGGTVTATTTMTPGGTCNVVNETTGPPVTGAPTCTMSGSPRVVMPGAVTTHTLTITNTGNQQRALSSVTNLTNHLSGGRFTLVSGSIQASAGSASLSGNNLNWSGTLPGGGTATITYQLRAANPSTGAGTWTSTTTLTPNSGTCTVTNETTAITTPPPPPPPPPPGNIDCRMQTSSVTVTPGNETTHTVTIYNNENGPRTVSSSTNICQAIASAHVIMHFVENSLNATVGEVSRNGCIITWTGTLPANSTATITYRLVASVYASNDDFFSVTQVTGGRTCTVVNRTRRTGGGPGNVFQCEMSSNPRVVRPGDLVTVTGTFTNRSPVGTSNNARVTISLPSQLELVGTPFVLRGNAFLSVIGQGIHFTVLEDSEVEISFTVRIPVGSTFTGMLRINMTSDKTAAGSCPTYIYVPGPDPRPPSPPTCTMAASPEGLVQAGNQTVHTVRIYNNHSVARATTTS